MAKRLQLLGFDYGASNGRAILGTLEDGKLTIQEMHRFPNEPVQMGDRFYWDFPRLYAEMRRGLLKCAQAGVEPDSIGIDTWGVDFGLLDENGRLLGNPIHYRDKMTDNAMEKAFRIMPKEQIFEHTGLAFMKFNTLYQLLALKEQNDAALKNAKTLLHIPDLFIYYLTGVKASEYSIVSTGQMSDPRTRDWSSEILSAFGIPREICQPVHESGKVRGPLLPALCEEFGFKKAPLVVAGAQHDTAAAVASVPAAKGSRFAYISSGTWSLLGVETEKPVVSRGVMDANYTNEGGVCGTTRVLKNIMGMWIIQECRRNWLKQGDCEDFAALAALAEKETPFRSLFDPDDDRFMPQGDMPARIAEYCRETDQPVPVTRPQFARAIYESLALKYRWAINRLERDILGEKIDCLHIVGGGSNNVLLNRMTASAIDRPVLAGPGEGTAIGNLLMQAMALGAIRDLDELREVVRNSFEVRAFQPEKDADWDAAYAKFLRVTGLED